MGKGTVVESQTKGIGDFLGDIRNVRIDVISYHHLEKIGKTGSPRDAHMVTDFYQKTAYCGKLIKASSNVSEDSTSNKFEFNDKNK
jgi:hypothetical protein